MFVVADQGVLARLRDAAKVALAWGSIVDDVKGKLNIDQIQKKQAETEQKTAEEVLPKVLRECYKWLLCPVQNAATDAPEVEAYPLTATGASTLRARSSRCVKRSELVIRGKVARTSAHKTRRAVLEGRLGQRRHDGLLGRHAEVPVPATPQEQGRARGRNQSGYGEAGLLQDGAWPGDGRFDGFGFGDDNVQLTDPRCCLSSRTRRSPTKRSSHSSPPRPLQGANEAAQATKGKPGVQVDLPIGGTGVGGVRLVATARVRQEPGRRRAKSYHGTAEVTASMAKIRLTQLAEEIVADPRVRPRRKREGDAGNPSRVPQRRARPREARRCSRWQELPNSSRRLGVGRGFQAVPMASEDSRSRPDATTTPPRNLAGDTDRPLPPVEPRMTSGRDAN